MYSEAINIYKHTIYYQIEYFLCLKEYSFLLLVYALFNL